MTLMVLPSGVENVGRESVQISRVVIQIEEIKPVPRKTRGGWEMDIQKTYSDLKISAGAALA